MNRRVRRQCPAQPSSPRDLDSLIGR
jgi:hypothetical protein